VERDFDSGFTQALLHREIEIAPITARPIASSRCSRRPTQNQGIFAEFLQETLGAGSFRVFAFSLAAASSASRTLFTSLP